MTSLGWFVFFISVARDHRSYHMSRSTLVMIAANNVQKLR